MKTIVCLYNRILQQPDRLLRQLWKVTHLYYLVFPTLLSGQLTLQIEPVHSNNRISENAGRDIIKDRQGYLWIGTIDGLNRFDGYQYKTFHSNPFDSTSISHNYVSKIFEDSHGNIWIGNFGGVDRYNRSCDCFERKRYTGGPVASVTDITEDHEGKVWIATLDGIYIWDQNHQNFTRHLHPNNGDHAMLDWRVTHVQSDDKGGIWIGWSEQGLSYYDQGTLTHYLQKHVTDGTFGAAIKDIHILADERMLLGTTDGAYLFDPENDLLEKKLEGETWSFFQLDGHILANQSFDGIHEWKPADEEFEKINIIYQGRPVDGDVQIYLKDNHGIVWFMFRGLAKYDVYENRFRHIEHFSEDPNTISAREVNGLNGDAEGNLVVTTQYGGLNYYDKSAGKWLNYRNTPLLNNELLHQILGTVVVLDDRDVWLQGSGQLYRYNLDKGLRENWSIRGSFEDIRSFLADKQKRHWIVDGGIFRIADLDKEELIRYDINDEIVRMVRDPDEVVWAISNTHIYRYDEERDSFEAHLQYRSEEEYRTPFLHALVNREYFWIGGTGLFQIDRTTREVSYFTTADGLPNDNIVSLLWDSKHLWLATNYGLSRFDPSRRSFLNFDKLDGLQDEIFLPNSAHRDKYGYLYFGGINGINIFHPDSLKLANPNPPEIWISEFQVFNKSVIPGRGSVLERDISQTSELTLPYRYSPISFTLTALGYSQSRKNQYAYMIEGVDLDWNHTRNNRTATYSNLPRGKTLTFKAMAANHDGIWSTPRELKIYVVPPFWETTWFKALLICLIALGTWVVYRIRIRNIRIKNRLLRQEVRHQTKEIKRQAEVLVEANRELKANAIAIETKAEQLRQTHLAQAQFFIGLSHELKTPLTIIMGYLEDFGKPDLPYTSQEVKDKIKSNAQQMVKLVNQLMDKARLESGQYRISVCEGELTLDVDSIVAGFAIIARQKSIELQFNDCWDGVKPCWYDPDILQKVLSNLISNALKFTPAGGEVQITVSQMSDAVGWYASITVSDNGIGIPVDQQEKIFDRFYQVANQGDLIKEGTGIGLSLVKKLVELHKGTLKVSSKPGHGSTFILKLPVCRSAFDDRQIAVSSRENNRRISENYFSGVFHEPHALVSTNRLNGNKSGKTLLIIEDNPETRTILKRQLQDDFLIIEADNGKEGLCQAIKHIPDLIICDVVMPEMDGLSFCRELKENVNTSHIPIVMLTALSVDEYRMQGLRQGADFYLAKPYQIEELRLVLANQLSHREAIRKRFLRDFRPDKVPEGLSEVDQKFIECLTRFIDNNLSESNLNTSDFCHHMGMSRTQMFRKLKSLTDMSLTEFIRDYRLKIAHQMLMDGRLNVSEVIYQTGFNSRSYFYQSFKKKFGFTPTELSGAASKDG